MKLQLLSVLAGLLVSAAPAYAADTAAAAPAAASAASSLRYTFSWPLDSQGLKPRGGSTRGAPIQLDTSPSPAWKDLQAPGLSERERDRRAILAMAGSYRVSFDFLEVASFTAPDTPIAPYQSWGTEKVYVDRDEPGFVSLVHILEMRIVEDNGKVSEPMVTKHWRQDWAFEPEAIVEYQGQDRWQRRTVPAAERRGVWSQTVYQVDESPRYASLGRWQHTTSFSTWLSGDTRRPLPRREWSVRKDYDALIGSNRHTVTPTGWTQEENNLKARLDKARAPDAGFPYLAREYGMARYERLAQPDFAAADRYYAATKSFWNEVLATWGASFVKHGTVTLKGPVDKLGLFVPLFERAEEIEEGKAQGAHAPVIRKALGEMGVPP